MATKLTLEEQETLIHMSATNRGVWEVYSDDSVLVGRLDKIATAYKENGHGGKWYRLEAGQIRFRPVLSLEQRAKLAANLRREQVDAITS